MNVLNVTDIERELQRYAARVYHPAAQQWVISVPRNYILGKLPEKDAEANFRHVVTKPEVDDSAVHYIPAEQLPPWALKAVKAGTLVWFDTIQPRRRELWHVLEVITFWFNHWKPTDTRLRRIDRISFPVATNAAVLWYKDVSENIWQHIADKPVRVASYEHGFSWVKLVSQLQFEREGKLMNHCVGNGGYYQQWRNGNAAEFFSLRDRDNQPHCTMQVSFDNGHPLVRKGSVTQCKGNSNRKPERKYQPYIRRFIDDMKWTITGDGSHID